MLSIWIYLPSHANRPCQNSIIPKFHTWFPFSVCGSCPNSSAFMWPSNRNTWNTLEHVGTRWNILFQRCSANKHRMVRMSTVTQNCWGAPLTCKACFGAAALRCSTLRTSHWMTDVTSPDSPDTWHEHESESETECVPICPDVATEVIFAMELDGQFAHVAPKITEPKGRWWHGDCNVSAAPKNSLCT